MARGSLIDGAPPVCIVLRHVWRSDQFAYRADEVLDANRSECPSV